MKRRGKACWRKKGMEFSKKWRIWKYGWLWEWEWEWEWMMIMNPNSFIAIKSDILLVDYFINFACSDRLHSITNCSVERQSPMDSWETANYHSYSRMFVLNDGLLRSNYSNGLSEWMNEWMNVTTRIFILVLVTRKNDNYSIIHAWWLNWCK